MAVLELFVVDSCEELYLKTPPAFYFAILSYSLYGIVKPRATTNSCPIAI